MLIYTEHTTPRLQFVLNFIFRDVFCVEFTVSRNKEEFMAYGTAKINYSTRQFAEALNVPFSGFLSTEGVGEIDTGFDTQGALPILFRADNSTEAGDTGTSRQAGRTSQSTNPTNPANFGNLDFDLFAAVFYMISRYEEYLPFDADMHGRFEAGNSLAGRKGFLEIPVADMWIRLLAEKLEESFVGLHLPAGTFDYLPTCDIDLPFAYLHRGRARTLGAGLK